MSAFDKVWKILKDEDDMKPNDDFHQLNDPNPTIAFGAAVRNNPDIAEMMRQRQEAYSKPYSEGGAVHECANCGKRTDTNMDDVYDEQFCCSRCAEGENPWCSTQMGGEGDGPYMCNFKVDVGRYMPDYGGYTTELHCPKCDNYLSGWLD